LINGKPPTSIQPRWYIDIETGTPAKHAQADNMRPRKDEGKKKSQAKSQKKCECLTHTVCAAYDSRIDLHPSLVRGMLRVNAETYPVNCLIDTGCLQASYMSTAVTKWINALTPALDNNSTSVICSPINGNCISSPVSFSAILRLDGDNF